MFGIEHGLGGSGQVQAFPLGIGQSRTGVLAQRANENPLGGIDVLAIAASGTAIALGQTQFRPVGGTVDAAMKAAWVYEGFE